MSTPCRFLFVVALLATVTTLAASPAFRPAAPAGTARPAPLAGCVGPDGDADGVPDACDNCPDEPNPDQADFDLTWTQNVISLAGDSPRSIHAADLDGDGDADVLATTAGDDTLAWFGNLDGLGSFGPRSVISTAGDFPSSSVAADLDADGHNDVLTAYRFSDEIVWHRNTDGTGTFGPRQPVSAAADGVSRAIAADLDADGNPDVLAANYESDTLSWYEDDLGTGNFTETWVSTNVDGPLDVFAADLDGDGDTDVLSASYLDDRVAWYENLDGAGTFGVQRIISTAGDRPNQVIVADLDGDGDGDVLWAAAGNDTVAWQENVDGAGTFGLEQVITTAGDLPEGVAAADLDADGDLDIVAGSFLDNRIASHQNVDGAGAFGPPVIITTDAVHVLSVFAADLNGDGRADVLSASNLDDKLAWYDGVAEGAGDACDNCPLIGNPDQVDLDRDGFGQACDCDDGSPDCAAICTDTDGDGLSPCDGDCLEGNPNCTTDCTDLDGDGYCVSTDCDETDPATHDGAPESNDGLDNQCPGDPGYGLIDEISGLAGFHHPSDTAEYSWPPQPGATSYEVAHSPFAAFQPVCTSMVGSATVVTLTGFVLPGEVEYILNRAVAPNVGSWGTDSEGTERAVSCP